MKFKFIFSYLLFVTVTLIFSSSLISCNSQKSITSFKAMDTFMTIQSFGKQSEKANLAAKERILNLENKISTTVDSSYIYRLNNNSENRIKTDDETFYLINYAQKISEQSKGALNIVLYPITSAWGFTTGTYKVPSETEIESLLKNSNPENVQLLPENIVQLESEMKMDLGAVGKGYAGDLAIQELVNHGVREALLDLGGNIQALGSKPDGSAWTIGIKNPWDGTVAASLKIINNAVITSGGYERFFTGDDGKKYIHIFDGKTGHPVQNEIASVTIVCDSGLYGDALSTTMFVMGTENAITYWQTYKDFQMIIITNDQTVYYTKDLEASLTFLYDFKNTVQIK